MMRRSVTGRSTGQQRPHRTLLVGYFRRGNFGDDAMLAGIESWLADHEPDIWRRVMPLPTRGLSGVPAFRSLVGSLRHADSMVLVGGTHFHDSYGFRSVPILTSHLFLALAARAMGCSVGFAGVGIGPLRRRSSRILVKAIFLLVTDAYVRDDRSATAARDAGIRWPLRVGFDLAALLPLDAVPSSSPAPPLRLGISLVPYFASYQDDPQLDRALVRTIVDVTSGAFQSTELTVEVLVLNREGRLSDFAISSMLETALETNGVSAHVTSGAEVDGLIATIKSVDAAVVMRYHAAMLAFLVGKPMLVVAYEDKCAHLAEQVGLDPSAVFRPEEVVAEPARFARAAQRLASGEYRASSSVATSRRRAERALGDLFTRLGAG